MFMGEYVHTIDAKGRIIIPSKFREELGEEFVLTLGLDGCLFAYPYSEWQIFVEKLKTLPGTKEARQLQRYFMAGAAACQADKQGRILIPAKLRESAALEKEIVFVGVLNKIEIWNKERWEQNNQYDDVDSIAEHMSQYGINF
ncbi:MraZ protein [Herbinix hemicellulosilytica]|uniref:Transcriptional regulator MraZ n=1 Tax=Herbinix hemicellulosilytica TaxID=1564487 RepID=A0A0H5SWE8_HERHM|nr:division/cell wall cluster transcriptional repressor MraZ [Herbinix hemicellulosilytica]RBP56787.1 MraZ protein [Herbinix hemicellulosilytica]CRZ34653.1 Protein MraZ [Herbinix hemicellulosilytica]